MGVIRYADDKPKDCAFCYFWQERKKSCELDKCFYILEEKKVPKAIHGQCPGCPYGRYYPCIGYCTAKILQEMKEKKYSFPFHYGLEAEQYSFYRVPKVLFTETVFRQLSTDAKLLYGLLLDRMQLSIRNQWFDEEARKFILKKRKHLAVPMNG